ncbi:MAG: ribosome silencing factor [Flavobacteriaceae bacterium]|nr:ribosome silencing factor [Flavobacteriaceae bacterium]
MLDLKIDSKKVLLSNIINAVDNLKGQDVKVLDFTNIDNAPCRYFVICNGTSSTHVRALVTAINKGCRKSINQRPYDIEGQENAQWVLIDYIDVVVHVFQKNIREFYDIEGLWGDAITTSIDSRY